MEVRNCMQWKSAAAMEVRITAMEVRVIYCNASVARAENNVLRTYVSKCKGTSYIPSLHWPALHACMHNYYSTLRMLCVSNLQWLGGS